MGPIKILVTSQKGGVGKSTLTANLAAYFAQFQRRQVALIDFDHQASSYHWIERVPVSGVTPVICDVVTERDPQLAVLKMKQALRAAERVSDIVFADLTWVNIFPQSLLLEFDLVLVPSSLSRVELDSTLEFVNRFSFVFNSRLRNPPKLVIVPSRVDNLQTYESIFSKSFNAGFFLSPPVMYSTSANDFFGTEFFVMTTNKEIRENFIEFGRSIEQLGEIETDLKLNTRPHTLTQKVSGSILDRFRAVRNSSQNPSVRSAANDSARIKPGRIKAVIPSFLMMGRDG
jgi:cellulose biosynthesis protein BcsQ